MNELLFFVLGLIIGLLSGIIIIIVFYNKRILNKTVESLKIKDEKKNN